MADPNSSSDIQIKSDSDDIPTTTQDFEFPTSNEDVHFNFDPKGLTGELMKDTKFMATLQAKMASMVGSTSGYIETLPEEVQGRIRALRKYQVEYNELEAEFMRKICLLEYEYKSKHDELFQKRSAVILGLMEPSDEDKSFGKNDENYNFIPDNKNNNVVELDEEPISTKSPENEQSDDTEMVIENQIINEGVKELSLEQTKESAAAKPQANAQGIIGIPDFWLTAMQNVQPLESQIQTHDRPILSCLSNIKVIYPDADGLNFILEFHFLPNSYFTDNVLTKTYTVKCEVDPADPFSFTGPEIVDCKGCEINWNKGKNVTRRHIRKRNKEKRASPKYVTSVEEQESFFNFFDPPQVKEYYEDQSEEIMTEIEADFTLGEIIKEKLVPRGVLYFTGEAMDELSESEGDGADESDAADEGGHGNEYDSANDPDYTPGKASSEKPPECQQSVQ